MSLKLNTDQNPITLPTASPTSEGLMSAADKTKLDALSPGGAVFVNPPLTGDGSALNPIDASAFLPIDGTTAMTGALRVPTVNGIAGNLAIGSNTNNGQIGTLAGAQLGWNTFQVFLTTPGGMQFVADDNIPGFAFTGAPIYTDSGVVPSVNGVDLGVQTTGHWGTLFCSEIEGTGVLLEISSNTTEVRLGPGCYLSSSDGGSLLLDDANTGHRTVLDNQGTGLYLNPSDNSGVFIGSPNFKTTIIGGLQLTTATGNSVDLTAAGVLHIGDTVATSVVVVGRTGQSLGFYGAAGVVKPASTGTVGTWVTGTAAAMLRDSTNTGGTGAAAYNFADVVRALKTLNLLTP